MTISRVPFRHEPGERFETPLSRAELRLRVLDAFDWCLPRADGERPRDCLRSPELMPYLFNDSRYSTVNDVVWARHCLLASAGVADSFPFAIGATETEHTTRRRVPPPEAGCRLLVWQRDLTVDDRVGEWCTDGYLDPSDMPPWDSWIAYIREEDDPVRRLGISYQWCRQHSFRRCRRPSSSTLTMPCSGWPIGTCSWAPFSEKRGFSSDL
jgi:hypothetical protein